MNGKSFFSKDLTHKQVLILLIAAFAVLITPLLVLSIYDVPVVDDFYFSAKVHDAVMSGGGLFAVLRAAWATAAETYYSWQGTIAAVFLFALQPGVFGDRYYVTVPFLMIFTLTAGIFIFVNALFRYVLKQEKSVLSAITACVISITCTQFLPCPSQGFYWYNGSVYYTFSFGIALILYAEILKLITREKNSVPLQLLVILLCVFTGFSNYIGALAAALILLTVMVLKGISGSHGWKRLIIPFLFFMAAFCVSMAAPGNSERQSFFVNRPGIPGSVILSFKHTVKQLYRWNSLPVIALYLLAVPALWKAAKDSGLEFRHPWLVALYSFCLSSAMNFPIFYAEGVSGEGRIENYRFFAMVLLIMLNIFYYEGWFIRKFAPRGGSGTGYTPAFLLGLGLLFTLGYYFSDSAVPITSNSALYSIRQGEARVYKNEYDERLPYLNDPDLKDVLLPPLTYHPYMLFVVDIQADPNDWRNFYLYDYFHKDSIIMIPRKEFNELINPQTDPSGGI